MDVAEALVTALIEQGELSGEQVDEVIATTVAKRQLAAEHARREERRQRTENAMRFRPD